MKKNQLKIGIILSYVIMGVNVCVQLIYTPIMLRILGKSEYGLYTLVGSVVSYLGLCGFGMNGAYLRFSSQYNEKKCLEKMASLNGTFIILNILASAIAVCAGVIMVQNIELIYGNRLDFIEYQKTKRLMLILIINIAISFPNSVFDSILISKECFFFQRGIKLMSVLLNPFVCLPLLLMGFDSIALVSVTTMLTILSFILNMSYCFSVLKIQVSFRNIQLSLIKQIGIFSFFLFLNMIIDQVNWSVDKLLLGRYWGTTIVAVYGVAAQLNALYTQCSTAISSVFAPRINQYYSNYSFDRTDRVNELFINVGRMQFLILMMIVGGLIFLGKTFIGIWAGAGYEEAYQIALLLIIPATIPLIQNIGIEIQRAQNKHYVRSIAYFIMMLLNILLSIPLSKEYGATGAAIGTAISMILGNGIFMNYYYQKYLEIDVYSFWKAIVHMASGLILPSTFGIFVMCFIEIQSIGWFIGIAIAYLVIYIISVFKWSLNQNERTILLKYWQKMYHV